MHKWLAPSSIYFLKMDRQLIVDEDKDDGPVNQLSQKLTTEELSSKLPKMQVSEKNGKMFALNNSLLQLMRRLEKKGKLQNGLIQVEVVPLSKVPTNIQIGMSDDIDGQQSNALKFEDSFKDINSDSSNDCSNKMVCLKQYLQTEDLKIIISEESVSYNKRISDEESDREEDEYEDEEEEVNDERSSRSSTSDEAMQCNVCDRSFSTANLLARHQIKKKHYGCSVCDTVFPTLRELEQHKETLEHWSDEETHQTEEDNEENNSIIKLQREELERLL